MEIQLHRLPKITMFLCMFLAQMTKSGFRAAAGRMTIPHMSSILWCGKAKKNYPQLATMDGILFTILQMEFTLMSTLD